MERWRHIAVAAGANLGDSAGAVRRAFAAVAASPLVRDARLSPLYRTAPVRVSAGAPDPGGEYVNAAIVAESAADPVELLAMLQGVERGLGRDRASSPHGAPRPIDLDLLLVGREERATAELTLPHPRMHERAFVLVPLADVAPDAAVPLGKGKGVRTVAQLLADLGPTAAGAARRIDP